MWQTSRASTIVHEHSRSAEVACSKPISVVLFPLLEWVHYLTQITFLNSHRNRQTVDHIKVWSTKRTCYPLFVLLFNAQVGMGQLGQHLSSQKFTEWSTRDDIYPWHPMTHAWHIYRHEWVLFDVHGKYSIYSMEDIWAFNFCCCKFITLFHSIYMHNASSTSHKYSINLPWYSMRPVSCRCSLLRLSPEDLFQRGIFFACRDRCPPR